MGRPRKPTTILELEGAFKKNPQRRRARANEPVATGPVGEPPEHMTEGQKAIWAELVALAPPGVLTNAHRWLVEITCQYMDKQRREGDPNCKLCEGKGGFRSDNRKFTICPRCNGLEIGEKGQLVQCLRLMGLTPSDQSKVHVPKTEEAGNVFTEIAQQGRKVGMPEAAVRSAASEAIQADPSKLD